MQAQLKILTADGKLARDIEASKYVISPVPGQCKDSLDQSVPASTSVGEPGSDVCFDAGKLVSEYKGLSEEDVMIQLAGLAMHEHVHHFQQFSSAAIKVNEADANRVGGYVLLTAKFVQLPLLKWTRPNSGAADFEEIRQLFDVIKGKERAFLAPRPADYRDYPDYIGKTDRGVLRLLPRETYDGKLSIRGGGAYYSFARLTYEYGYGSDIALEQNRLSVGFAGYDFGYIVRLGALDLASIAVETPGVQFLDDFIPATSGKNALRAQQTQSSDGVLRNGFRYANRTDLSPVPGDTFAVRSIVFGSSDILVAFRVIRIEGDSSIVLAWRLLKKYKDPPYITEQEP